MKKFQLSLFLVIGIFLTSHLSAFAAATVPQNTVWFTPAAATTGSAIILNTLVYNNTNQPATLTVAFTTPTAIIGTKTIQIYSQSAQTVSQDWVMPKDSTSVTVAVTAATNAAKKSVPSLIGTLGTLTIGGGVIPTLTTASFPGSAQLNAWFGPFLSKVETFRLKESTYFSNLRDTTKAQLGITATATNSTVSQPVVPASSTNSDGLAPIKLNSPGQYATYIYASALAGFFSNQILFYIGSVLLILLVLRFIVNLVS